MAATAVNAWWSRRYLIFRDRVMIIPASWCRPYKFFFMSGICYKTPRRLFRLSICLPAWISLRTIESARPITHWFVNNFQTVRSSEAVTRVSRGLPTTYDSSDLLQTCRSRFVYSLNSSYSAEHGIIFCYAWIFRLTFLPPVPAAGSDLRRGFGESAVSLCVIKPTVFIAYWDIGSARGSAHLYQTINLARASLRPAVTTWRVDRILRRGKKDLATTALFSGTDWQFSSYVRCVRNYQVVASDYVYGTLSSFYRLLKTTSIPARVVSVVFRDLGTFEKV